MKALLIGTVLVGAAIALAPQATADGQDDNFLALLAQAGIPAHDGIPTVIDSGHKVCQALDGGQPASAVVETLANFAYGEDPSHDLGQYHRTMVRFVRVSVRAFCPGNQGKLSFVSGLSGEHRMVLTGLTVPNPPQIPPEPEPTIKMLVPPVAAPSPAPKQAPPPKQVPPPPPQVVEPPPQLVEPPATGPQGGTGDGGPGSGANGGGSSGGGPVQEPAPKLPEGHIVLAP